METIIKAATKVTVVICCQFFFIRGQQRHLAAISGGGRAAQGLWTEQQLAGELLVFEPVYVFFYKKNQIQVHFIFLKSLYFKAIQTAVLYQNKNMYKMFRPNFLIFVVVVVAFNKIHNYYYI